MGSMDEANGILWLMGWVLVLISVGLLIMINLVHLTGSPSPYPGWGWAIKTFAVVATLSGWVIARHNQPRPFREGY